MFDAEVASAFETLVQRQQAERARLFARSPKKMADVLGQLMTRRGYGRLKAANHLEQAWQQAAGEFAAATRIGKLRRGVLEIVTANSILLTELGFARHDLLSRLRTLLPNQEIRDLKFRSGTL